MVQTNAPYPATPCLAGTLTPLGHDVAQADASLLLALRLFSRSGILALGRALRPRSRPACIRHFRQHLPAIADTVGPVIRFLQGQDPTLAHRIVTRQYLPEGPRFAALDPILAATAHSPLALHDFAVHLASLYLDDIADAIRAGIDPHFELARYGERLAVGAASFDALAKALRRRKLTVVETLIEAIARDLVTRHRPELVGFTVPFPGNLYAALRMARCIRTQAPGVPIVLGGGYANTELRELSEPRLFDYVDYVTLDDGATPLLRILEHISHSKLPLLALLSTPGAGDEPALERTFYRRDGRVRYVAAAGTAAPPAPHNATPRLEDLPLGSYFPMAESVNPMHRLWSCGRWNKLMLAHGCYWRRCAFCDTRLDYIARYHPIPVPVLLEQIEDGIRQTGQTGFHFVDEAMPPALLRPLAEALLERELAITWWGNIRFDKAFTPELASLLARSGCVAVTGGLEAATDRLLTLMDKGFTLRQAARVLAAFADAGIMTHAYLMYGFPSQTEQDTVDALEYVRQLFEAGLLHSAYWHRFALTVHSPIYRDPSRFGIRVIPPQGAFARNEVAFEEPIPRDHARLGQGLRKALYNYMHHTGLDLALSDWFEGPIPAPTPPTDFVAGCLSQE
jgi:radical SAM superfamily enzyme YgiQ (UPF0313 family)